MDAMIIQQLVAGESNEIDVFVIENLSTTLNSLFLNMGRKFCWLEHA